MPSRSLPICLLLFFVLCATCVAAQGSFRVSGVIGEEGSWLYAILEDPQGGCRIARKGDALDTAFISDITAQGVLVLDKGVERFLKLDGTAFIAKPAPNQQPVALPDSERMVEGKLTFGELKAAVAVVSHKENAKGKELPQEILNGLLNLPPQAQITAVNGRDVASVLDSAAAVGEALNRNVPPRITYSENGIAKEVYIMLPRTAPLNGGSLNSN